MTSPYTSVYSRNHRGRAHQRYTHTHTKIPLYIHVRAHGDVYLDKWKGKTHWKSRRCGAGEISVRSPKITEFIWSQCHPPNCTYILYLLYIYSLSSSHLKYSLGIKEGAEQKRRKKKNTVYAVKFPAGPFFLYHTYCIHSHPSAAATI